MALDLTPDEEPTPAQRFREAVWQGVRRQRASAARALRSRRVLPTRAAIDAWLRANGEDWACLPSSP